MSHILYFRLAKLALIKGKFQADLCQAVKYTQKMLFVFFQSVAKHDEVVEVNETLKFISPTAFSINHWNVAGAPVMPWGIRSN